MSTEVLFHSLILKALKLKSTDLHLTFREGQGFCEFRTLHGLVKVKNINLDRNLLEYIKYHSKLDLLKSYRPQTGYFKVDLGQQIIQLRVAHIKNNFTESIVIRIMNPPRYISLDTLFKADDLSLIKAELKRSAGLILISGTTGSGKTTTLYTILNALSELKIYTIEDPIEAYHSQLIQLQVNERQDLNFETALKQVLRHDPNLIVIGEIRDEIEAKAALRCALTGHLVLSTIHSNSASKTIDRLENLGVPRNEILSVLNLVIYQKLESDGKSRIMSYELYQNI
ncbi:MAG: Flp pilus assembly complex ATPase component TadA [Erysipelotrichaceae bacterium]|nr:Flp pilus assembly complex ATPase component TadA [Erysipelotrichaceae bacterium]